MLILIVEDDIYYSKRIVEMLMDFSLHATVVSNTHDALSINLSDFDAALIDVMLPNDPEASGISNEESRAGFFSGVALARRILCKKPDFPIILFSSSGNLEAENWARENNIQFCSKDDGRTSLKQTLQKIGVLKKVAHRAFIVHGHDEKTLLELKDYIQNSLKWQKPIVLRDEPSSGKTIIEKFEDFASSVDYVFVLMTPDDVIQDDKKIDKRRSRQNVIFEMGFFYGQFGRKSGKVIVLYEGPLELPSDIVGIIWVDISKGIKAAGEDIRRELNL